MTERFAARFPGRVAVLHSSLTRKQRIEEWLRILHGRAPIVVGTRSAVFAPLQNLELIIVDEEHETTYKQEETPRYHARDTAIVRAAAAGRDGGSGVGDAFDGVVPERRAQEV